MTELRLILVVIISIISCLILASILASVTRRVQNKKRYERLDGLRDRFRAAILKSISSGSVDSAADFARRSRIKPGSLEWVALEQVLLDMSEDGGNKDYIRSLLDAFGYRKYYLNHLSRKSNPIAISAAADKLGRIGDPLAVEPLSLLLDHKRSEVATVAFRALCRIGSANSLNKVLQYLPGVLKDNRVTVKSVQTSLLLFGPWAGDRLLKYAENADNPEVLAVVLETLASFPAKQEILEFARSGLSHPDPEVRGKALRIIARGDRDFLHDDEIFTPLINDPVWFVRLQAAKAIGKLKCGRHIEMLKKLALDERWQVRDAATISLLDAGEGSLNAVLELLESPDRYARESISEEIQRTGFVLKLIDYLGGKDVIKKDKAKRILSSMHGVGFSTPMREAAQSGKSGPTITAELLDILFPGTSHERIDRRSNN